LLNKNHLLLGECLERAARLLGSAVSLLPVKVAFLRDRAVNRLAKLAFLRRVVLPAPTEQWGRQSEALPRDS